jgi:hypothetical protein
MVVFATIFSRVGGGGLKFNEKNPFQLLTDASSYALGLMYCATLKGEEKLRCFFLVSINPLPAKQTSPLKGRH